jgi:WD40 repeat protein
MVQLSEKTNAHSGSIYSVAFSPDGTKIVSGSDDKTIKVWDSGALRAHNRPPWPKLTPVGLSGRRAGAVEREDERPQRLHQVGRLLPGRDQDCVWIVRQDDQSLGFRCAEDIKIAPPWPKLTLVGLSGRQAGAAEREDERPQQRRHVGGVFPGRDQDCVGI